ncbi:putative transporter [Acrodontium crateriforme]|uniref:Transporter n=1 Tax=Acrodontium crateriforme TaxID=150365 RepID=A0AAQ3M258_9PEZI|nr:putative transporter [Acrodontium crateriforme]
METRMTTNKVTTDPYSWDGLTGWKSYRTLRPFRGMYCDVRRRLPYYWSDIKDGWSYRTFAATVRIFFVNLLPAIAFQLDMTRNTGGYFGINEGLFSSALAALVFSTMSCQPLTVVGITGLISLFNYTIYDIAKAQGIVDLYPQFIAWVSIWAAITHWMTSIFNWCDYMRYITDFSSTSFGMYVGIIYMIKGVEELVAQFPESNSAAGYLSIVIALCYWFTVYGLELIGGTIYFKPSVRKMLSDYAYPIATIFWTGFSHIPGRIKDAGLTRVPHTRAFHPTVDRSWLVDFWNLPVKWVFVALPIGILLTMLFYYDHNVSSLGAQAKQFPLKKPAGFHWDFFLLGCTCFIGGIVGIPLPNGLVPQAPVHTDSCTEYVDRLSKTKEKYEDTPDDEWIKHNKKIIEAEKVHEQRISHFLMALGFVGLMTGPLLIVLHTIPRALFSGVFFVVGWGSIGGNPIMANLLYLIQEKRFVDPGEPRNKLKKARIALYLAFQAAGILPSVAISQTIAAIGFPVIIIALIPLRWIIMPRIFTEEELLILDAPTASASVVLASMGGAPELPEVKRARQIRGNVEGGETGMSSGATTAGSNGEGMRSRQFFKDEEEEINAAKEKERDRDGVPSTLNTGHA